jgi:hypothetical protein
MAIADIRCDAMLVIDTCLMRQPQWLAAGDSDDIGGDGQRSTQPLRRRDAFDSGGVVGIKEKFV